MGDYIGRKRAAERPHLSARPLVLSSFQRGLNNKCASAVEGGARRGNVAGVARRRPRPAPAKAGVGGPAVGTGRARCRARTPAEKEGGAHAGMVTPPPIPVRRRSGGGCRWRGEGGEGVGAVGERPQQSGGRRSASADPRGGGSVCGSDVRGRLCGKGLLVKGGRPVDLIRQAQPCMQLSLFSHVKRCIYVERLLFNHAPNHSPSSQGVTSNHV